MTEPLSALSVPLGALAAIAPVGVALVDQDLRYVHVDETLARINGRRPEDHLGRTLREALPHGAAVLEPLVRRVLAGEAVTDLRLVSPPPDGRVFRGSLLPVDGPGGPLCLALLVRDHDDEDTALALRITEQRLRLALEGTEVGFWEWDVREDVVRWSENHGPIFGRPRGTQPRDYAEFLDAIVEEDRERVETVVGRALEGHDWVDEQWRIRRPDGELRWVESRGHLLRGDGGAPLAIVGVTSDVTARRRREERRTFLAEATALLSRSLDVEETLREIARSAVPELAEWCTVHLGDPDGVPELATVAHADPERLAEVEAFAARYPPDPRAPTGAAAVLRSGRPELYEHITDELLVATARSDEHLRMIRSLGMRAAMLVPLGARNRTLGVLSFIAADPQGGYDEADLALAEELGRRAGLALENARLHAHARDVAVTLQRSLLPGPPPEIAGLELAVRYLPGQEGTEVGGDWYDVVALPDGRVVLVVGDVEGRGTTAAARMGRLRAVLRAYVFDAQGPVDALTRLDLLLGEQPEEGFATVVLADVAADRRSMVLASAGHPPPVVLPPAGGPRLAGVAPGVPVGAPVADRLETQVALEPGTRVLLYTDGLVERRTAPLGAQLDALVAACADAPAGTAGLLDHVTGQLLGAAQADDVALLAAHLLP